jgi:hypothetical protein
MPRLSPWHLGHFALSFAAWFVGEYVLIEGDGLAPHTPVHTTCPPTMAQADDHVIMR